LSKKLHTADKECETYTIELMDKLEQTKAQHADNDAIMDDIAAQAYVEAFALETFERADKSVREGRVTA
jgi:vacuolar protein sorting-associated protein VTA1